MAKESSKIVLPTLEQLDAMAFNNGKGFDAKTLKSWGIKWPPPKGWAKALRRQLQGLPPEDGPRKKNKPQVGRKVQRPKLPPIELSLSTKQQRMVFYESWEWRTLRKQVLNEQGYACQCCGSAPGDKMVSGANVRVVVDHIRPLSKYWNLRLDRNNLQVLCDECNQGKGAWDETDHR